MKNRGNSEPEYIDDDEFFDPDESSGTDSRSLNVLGGSGSRHTREASVDPPDGPAHGDRNQRDSHRGRGKQPRSDAKAGRKAAKARNPAPAIASSEERRARLAGRHQDIGRRAEEEKRSDAETRTAASDKRWFGGLRQRFSRKDNSQPSSSGRDASDKRSRNSIVARPLSGIRNLLRRGGAAEGESQAGHGGKADQPAGEFRTEGGGRFGASRGSSKPAAKQRVNVSSAQPPHRSGRDTSARPSKAPKIAADGWLDLDRKLDIVGVAMVFGAIVYVFSALSPQQGAIGNVHAIIGQLLGWGAIAVPVSMFAVGMWLIVRHFGDEPPIIDPVRLTGMSLAFLSALVLCQYGDSLGYPERCGRDCIALAVQQAYQAGRGGGLVGGWIYNALVTNLTELGGFAVVLMALTIAAMLTTRSSVVELALVTIGLSRNIRTRVAQVAVERRAARLQARQQQLTMPQDEGHVRVSKPEPAQLGATPAGGPALPEPAGDWMPIPNRLRSLFGHRAESTVQQKAESVSLPATSQPRSSGLIKRFFGRKQTEDPRERPAALKDQGGAGRLERFLNLGDNLPASAAASAESAAPSASPRASRTRTRPNSLIKSAESLSGISSTNLPSPGNDVAPPPSSPPLASPASEPFSHAGGEEPEFHEQTAGIDASHATGEFGSAAESKHFDEATNSEDPVKSQDNEQRKSTIETPASDSQTARARFDWDMPQYRELLSAGTASELDQAALQQQAQVIEDTLASFGAPGRVVEVNSGPVITQYGVEPSYITAKTGKRNRVKVGAIAKLDKDLQLALGARSLRMEAPVPGKGYVGIEVPNPASARVGLRDVMDTRHYQKIDSPLAIALGMSVDGKPIAADLTQMPHLLIAGTTGSGKSVCVNAIINSILVNNSPEAVRFIMVDPKRVELTGYNGLPHLVAPVVVELERILGVLRWVTTEMDERYKKFSQAGARNIIDFNAILDPDLAPMPYVVVVIDELADLMMMAPDDTERAIARIAALARATGIHLVIATQRPSVDVVTGLIKANCPARIAFAVASSVDSRVIIDQPGAERLLGKGDMLYLSGDAPAPQRVQGVHVSNEEIQRIGRYWKLQKSGIVGVEPIPLPPQRSSPARSDSSNRANAAATNGDREQAAFWDMTALPGKAKDTENGLPEQQEDELYQTAVDMVRRLDKASVSLLQRRLRIGYTRAARLIDMMEERGVVGPPKEGSSKPRDVLKK